MFKAQSWHFSRVAILISLVDFSVSHNTSRRRVQPQQKIANEK